MPNKNKEMDKNLLKIKLHKMYLFTIVFSVLFSFIFWLLLNNKQGYYSDQGYRLCINYITNERSFDRKLVAACLENYLDLKEKIIKDNY